ncbi:MAG: hypothetical protein BWX64_01819 [Acidobacteria bacterium ADurb.Bin051]|nr:MAG: hypothetical protein BWX64_01819 [Acidobacteria bacterium ADurb.Bin051]
MVDEHRPTGIGHPGGVGLDPGPAGHESKPLLGRILERSGGGLDGGVRLRGADRLSRGGQASGLAREEGLERKQPHLLLDLRDRALQLGDAAPRVLEVAVAGSGWQEQCAVRAPLHPLLELRLVHTGERRDGHVRHVLDVAQVTDELVVGEVQVGQVEQRRGGIEGRGHLSGVAGDERDFGHPGHRPGRLDELPLARVAGDLGAERPDLEGNPGELGGRIGSPVDPDPLLGSLPELPVLDPHPLLEACLEQPPAASLGTGPKADQILRRIADHVGAPTESELVRAAERTIRRGRHVDHEEPEAVPPGVGEDAPEELVQVRPAQVHVLAPLAQADRDVFAEPDRLGEDLADDLPHGAGGGVEEGRPLQPVGVAPRARKVLALVGWQVILPSVPDGLLTAPERAQEPAVVLGRVPRGAREGDWMLLAHGVLLGLPGALGPGCARQGRHRPVADRVVGMVFGFGVDVVGLLPVTRKDR